MEIIAKIIVPKEVYQFYANAASHISGRTPEEVMADALSAYSRMLQNSSVWRGHDPARHLRD